jgi:hypothetical protein
LSRPPFDRLRLSRQAPTWLLAATLVLGLTAARTGRAANCTWNASSTANWDASTSNWNGCGGRLPGAGDQVTFKPNGQGSNVGCILDIPIKVQQVTFANNYTATVTGGANSVTVSGNWTMNSGTFVGGSGTVSIGGNLHITSSGNFSATTGLLAVSGALQNQGTLSVAGTLYLSATNNQNHTFGGASLNQVQVGNSSTGLVGYWKLDEASGTTATDSSGTGNTGTYNSSGVAHTTSVPSSISFTDPDAVTLDGSTGYVSLGITNLPANDASQSISLWFKGTPNVSPYETMLEMASAADASAVAIGFSGSNLAVWVSGGATLVSTAAPTDGGWHQAVYVYDGTTDSLYLDGSLADSETTSAHQAGTPNSAYIGTALPNYNMFSGSLDDVRVYQRDLTSTEISQLASGLSPSAVSGKHTFQDAFACTGDFVILNGTVTGNQTLSVGGNWYNAGTYTDTGTVTMVGTSASGTITTGGSSFGALTINGYGGTYTLQDATAVTGNLTVTSGTLAGTQNVTVGGSFSNSATYSNYGTLTLTSPTNTATVKSNGARFSGVTLNAAGGTVYTLQDRLWVPGGTLTLTKGTLAAGSNTLHVGALSIGTGVYSGASATLILDGTSSQTLPTGVTTFGSLRVEDPSENNLVGYWKLDEANGTWLQDLSGNGNTGTLSGSGITWSTASVPSTITFDDYASAAFDGSSGYASLGTTGLPATNGAVTISAWVKLGSASGNQDFVTLSGSGTYLRFGLRGGSFAASSAMAGITGPSATTGAWHHLAYTYNGSVDSIYVDGVATTGSFTHQSGATTAAWMGTLDGATELFNGSMDDVRIYNAALSASQISQLAAGRYANTGGIATVTLGANTTVAGLLALDDGILGSSGKTMAAGATGPTAALVNTGTYTVGSAAQTFSGGLTVQPSGVLTLASSGGSVNVASSKTLTVDGTLNASTTGATIQSVSGTYTFKVGSTATATPTVSISGLTVKGTNGGLQIGATTGATTTVSELDNVKFSGGTGAQYLLVNAKSMYLTSSGCTFDAGVATGATTKAVTAVGNGTADGETRAIFGNTTCATNWANSASDTSCGTAAKSDDDANNDGVGDNPSTNGAVVQMVRAAETDTAGSVIGFPSSAFDWNTFTYYSTYVAFHNASGGSSDVVYVRDESGNPLYSWTVPTAGETISGTPQWITTGSKHYLYVATTAGHVYRLVDTGTGTTSGTLTLDSSGAWSTNPFNCSCTISTPLAMDASNLYWGSTTSGKNFWTLGQSTESNPTPVAITPAVTNAGLSIATINGTTYAYMGVTGNMLKIGTASQSIVATNSSPGSASIFGRIVLGYGKSGTWRAYAGDSGGTMWALDATSGFATAGGLWSYATANGIQSSPYYDHDTDTLHYGTQGGTIIVLNGASGTTLNAGYPYTPAGGSGDPIQAAPLYYGGVLVVGSTGGKLYFLDRNTGTGVSLIRQYAFGPSESVSGIGFDPNVNRYMVSTASSSSNDGRLYYFDLVADPTPGSI